VALLGLAVPVIASRPATAVKAGDWCGPSRTNQVELSTDPTANAEPLVCHENLWQPGQPTPDPPPAEAAPDPAEAVPAVEGPVGRELGDYCAGPPSPIRTLSGSSGQPLICEDNHWAAEPGVPLGERAPLDPQVDGIPDANVDGLSDSIAPHLNADALGTANVTEPLPFDLGNPTGLPPGVGLPPGTRVLNGFPRAMPSEDWWKANRWLTEAVVSTTNIEAVNAHFVKQCANIGWLFDPRRVTRLPVPTPPAKGFDQSVTMVLGECRTVLGSPTDPTRIRPWYMAWSASLRPGSPTVELVVELRSSPREGGRPG